ncbi:MAG: cytochrome P450 [Mycobacteriales bacterium]|nr:cytochrome P450 [Mycobacteriales bacterium]
MASPPVPRARLTPSRLRGFVDRSRTTALFDGLRRMSPRAVDLVAGSRSATVVLHPSLAREVLVTKARSFAKGEALGRTELLLGKGLLTADRERHRRHRPLVQPAFHHSRMAGYADDVVLAGVEHARAWRPGAVVEMTTEMQELTLAAVGRTLLGTATGAEAAAKVGPALATALRAWEVALIPGMLALLDTPLPPAVRTRAALASLDALVRDVVADGRRRSESGPGDDVVAALLASGELDDDELRDEVMTLLLAGHETTANALTWTWHLLSDHPAVATRVRAQVAEAVGDRLPAYSDLPSLPYLYAVVAEAMRLFPPAWMLEREAVEDVVLDGIAVPRGRTVLVPVWVLHRDPDSWDAPLQFRPERWLRDGRFDEDAPGQPRGAWVPFGAGTRQCIGESFAWTEAVLLLAVLARDWAPRRVADQRVGVRAAVTLRPAHGMRMELVPAR